VSKKNKKATKDERTGSLGFEDKLWNTADLLRNNMDPAEYKHVVLGLIFLKYISDAFEERRESIREAVADADSPYYVAERTDRERELLVLREDRDEYTAENVFWVPDAARWTHLQASATQPNIGKLVDSAMDAIEAENDSLKGVLPKVYALPNLDKHNLGKLINEISGIGLGSKEHREKDTLGRVYEYFLSRFASTEGKGGGEFYTPSSVVRVLVEMLEPFKGRVYDPCCGSGGMFVQSLRFIEAHNGKRDQVTIYGQESNRTTWRMARMNMAIRGIEATLGRKHADSFHEDMHPDLRADYILANPPFNISQWGGERLDNDVRWKYGTPPASNANFAWLQHMVHHLAPNGAAGIVLSNGSMASMQSGEGEIRRNLVEADLLDCMVALPTNLFYATSIPVCLWLLRKNRSGDSEGKSRSGHTLFIDARGMGQMETRTHKVLDESEINTLADTYHNWRKSDATFTDVPGFAASATIEQIAAHGFVLTPGRYVGAELPAEEEVPIAERLEALAGPLRASIETASALDAQITGSIQRIIELAALDSDSA